MNLVVIAEHSVDVDLLRGGRVLDAGCRDFGFSRGLVERGCRVAAVDADPTVEDPHVEGVCFSNLALASEAGMRSLVMREDPQARHLGEGGVQVSAVTVEDVMRVHGVAHWDVAKLDIEGSEYEVLRAWPGPVATQVSIEFHEHCFPQPQRVYDEIFAHLTQWYVVVQHVKDARYCAGYNFWDTLLVLRDRL